jgi:metal-responsive CopG/Arc/MetJ family transcriptional regulator
MKTAISIPDPLFRAADRLAQRLGISRSQVFQRAVSAYLEAHQDERVTEALNSVYEKSDADVGLDPVIERMQAISLVREKW